MIDEWGTSWPVCLSDSELAAVPIVGNMDRTRLAVQSFLSQLGSLNSQYLMLYGMTYHKGNRYKAARKELTNRLLQNIDKIYSEKG